jgi:hypothetical protein
MHEGDSGAWIVNNMQRAPESNGGQRKCRFISNSRWEISGIVRSIDHPCLPEQPTTRMRTISHGPVFFTPQSTSWRMDINTCGSRNANTGSRNGLYVRLQRCTSTPSRSVLQAAFLQFPHPPFPFYWSFGYVTLMGCSGVRQGAQVLFIHCTNTYMYHLKTVLIRTNNPLLYCQYLLNVV